MSALRLYPARCTARNRHGTPCERPATPGATVCHHHGGKEPHAQRTATQHLHQADAYLILHRNGAAPGPPPGCFNPDPSWETRAKTDSEETRRHLPPPETGPIIAKARHSNGLTFRSAAAAIGCSPGHLHKLEHGQRCPSVAMVAAIVTALDIDGPDADVLATAALENVGRSYHPAREPSMASVSAARLYVQHIGERRG